MHEVYFMHLYIHTFIHIYIYIYITQVYIHMYIHTCVHTCLYKKEDFMQCLNHGDTYWFCLVMLFLRSSFSTTG